MNEGRLKLTVRTPREIVFERFVSSVRVPTETGQVGVRPRAEPLLLAVEPGLVLVRRDADYHFVGTAGGLLRFDGVAASLLTPLAVTGDDEEAVLDELERALAEPSVEMEARATLSRLQTGILRELREGKADQLRRVEDGGMSQDESGHHRDEVRRAMRRDFSRRARREAGHRSFWQSLGVLGMVGWPIALATVGGAFAGRYLDSRFQTGVRFTLMLLTAGAALGAYTAWRALKEPKG